jgi:PAS domain S-box-containing protein
LTPAAAAIARAYAPDPTMAGLARLAAAACRAPLASIEVVGSAEIWCSSLAVLPPADHPRSNPYRSVAAQAVDVVEIPDTRLQPGSQDHACLADGREIRFFAGIAVRARGGELLGILAVYAASPRRLDEPQRASLRLLAEQILAQLELRGRVAELELIGEAGPTPLARALVESAPVVIYHSDLTGNLTYANREYRRIFGLSPQQSTDDWDQGVHPDDRVRAKEAWNDFSRNPRPMRFDYRTLAADGSIRYYAEQVVPANGVAGYVGTISDFTDLVQARDELHQAETVFQNTFNQAPIGIAYADRSGKFLRCNDTFCSLLGLDSEALVATSIFDLTHADDLRRTAVEMRRLWAGETACVDHERRYKRSDGSVVWVRVTTALVRDGDREPQCSIEFLRDISLRKQLAADLLQQQTLLEAVITDLPVALIACDVSGRITHFNRAAVELQCVDTSPNPSTTPIFLADGVSAVPKDAHPLAQALRGETTSNLEFMIAPKAAHPRSILVSAHRLIGPEDQTLGAVAVIQDTTERKLADLELERVHKELVTASRQAGMAEVATNVLHNVGNILNSINISASLVADRVTQSKAPGVARVAALLQEQGDALAQFLTHDARGKRIPEYLATLGKQLAEDQTTALDELRSLRDNLEHIKETVTMQQSYAKLCGVTETVAVADLMEDGLRLNAGAFARHGVMLRREFAEVAPITVDKHKVLQILVNLLRNAKYACDESGRPDKQLTLRIEPAVNCVRISVIDNGMGIAPEHMDRLFTHGFTTRQSGHGFGLHSCALAAQELGGSLRAESDGIGRGAAFVLELPLGPQDRSRG